MQTAEAEFALRAPPEVVVFRAAFFRIPFSVFYLKRLW